jgi:hypothetical protein
MPAASSCDFLSVATWSRFDRKFRTFLALNFALLTKIPNIRIAGNFRNAL